MFIAKGTRIRILPERDVLGRVIPQDDGLTGREAVVTENALVGAAREETEIEVEVLNHVRLKLPDYRIRILRTAEITSV